MVVRPSSATRPPHSSMKIWKYESGTPESKKPVVAVAVSIVAKKTRSGQSEVAGDELRLCECASDSGEG